MKILVVIIVLYLLFSSVSGKKKLTSRCSIELVQTRGSSIQINLVTSYLTELHYQSGEREVSEKMVEVLLVIEECALETCKNVSSTLFSNCSSRCCSLIQNKILK